MKQLTPRWIAMLAITVITIYVVWLIFAPFLNVLLWSVVLTVIAAPINNALRRTRWAHNPNLSAFLTLLAVLLIVVVPTVLLVGAAIAHASEAVTAVQQGIEHVRQYALAKTADGTGRFRWLNPYFDLRETLKKVDIGDTLQNASGTIAKQGFGLVSNTVIALVQFMLVLFTTYYMLRDSGKLLTGVRTLLPLTPSQTDTMMANVKNIISASLKGTVLISAIQGILGGIAFWFLGLPAPYLWGGVMFLTSMIPVVGSSIIWGPAALYLLINDHAIKALILVIWGVGVIATVDNILRPPLVGSKTRMHELMVFFSVLGGLQLFGPVGIVAGPIVVGVAQGLLRIFFEEAAKAEPLVTATTDDDAG